MTPQMNAADYFRSSCQIIWMTMIWLGVLIALIAIIAGIEEDKDDNPYKDARWADFRSAQSKVMLVAGVIMLVGIAGLLTVDRI